MKSNTSTEDVVFDVGSLYAQFQGLKDQRKPRGIRYRLGVILVMMSWRSCVGKTRRVGLQSGSRRIEADVVNPEELERLVGKVLAGRKFFGKQVLVSMDGKVLRGTLDEAQNGTYLLASYLPKEGLVLMEVALENKGSEIPSRAGMPPQRF